MTYEQVLRWGRGQGFLITDNDLKNANFAQDKIDELLDLMANKATTAIQRNKFNSNSFRNPFKQGTFDEILERDVRIKNNEYLRDVSSDIDSSNNFNQLNRVEVDSEFEQATVNRAEALKEDRKQELSNVLKEGRARRNQFRDDSFRESFFGTNPDTAVDSNTPNIRNARRVGSIMRFYKVNESEARQRLGELGIQVDPDGRLVR